MCQSQSEAGTLHQASSERGPARTGAEAPGLPTGSRRLFGVRCEGPPGEHWVAGDRGVPNPLSDKGANRNNKVGNRMYGEFFRDSRDGKKGKSCRAPRVRLVCGIFGCISPLFYAGAAR